MNIKMINEERTFVWSFVSRKKEMKTKTPRVIFFGCSFKLVNQKGK